MSASLVSKPGVLVMVSSLGCGGAEKHAISLLNTLDISDFRLAFAAVKNDGQLLAQLHTSRLDACFSLEANRGVEWRAVRELARRIDAHAIDVVLCTNGYAALYAWLASQLATRSPKLVEVFHTTDFGDWRSRLRMLVFRFVFRRCDALIYVSHLQRAYWQQQGVTARHERVIHNGIDAVYFTDTHDRDDVARVRGRWGFASDDYVIGMCAALRPEKAHGDFLEALARLRQRGVNAKGLIIGEGPERQHIEAIRRRLGLESQIVITGFQSDVRPSIASCDVMALVSHSIETFSVAVLEAMAMAKPVVLSRVGGAAEQVTHGVHGLLFERGDIEALTQHLACLQAPEERARMGQAAATRVRQQYTLEKMIDAYAQELRHLSSTTSTPCLNVRVAQT